MNIWRVLNDEGIYITDCTLFFYSIKLKQQTSCTSIFLLFTFLSLPDLHRIGVKLIFVLTRFKCMALIAQAAWLRCLNSAAL